MFNKLATTNTKIRLDMEDTFGRQHGAEKIIKTVAIAGPFLKYPGVK
jgi:hypothetical protein